MGSRWETEHRPWRRVSLPVVSLCGLDPYKHLRADEETIATEVVVPDLGLSQLGTALTVKTDCDLYKF